VLSLHFESQKQDKISNFELKLMNIQGESLGIPDNEYKAEVKMPAAEFQRICRDMTILGDTVTVSATKAEVKFSVAGELGSGSIIIKHAASVDDNEDEQTKITLGAEPCSLTFALRYLNYFTRATALSGSVILKMSPELPLVVEYKIDQLGYLRYYLAPKIEEDSA